MIIRLLVGLRRFNPIGNCSWNTYSQPFLFGTVWLHLRTSNKSICTFSWHGEKQNLSNQELDCFLCSNAGAKSRRLKFTSLLKKCFMMENRLSQENVTPAWACSDHRTPSSDTVTGKRKFPWMIIFRIDFSYRDNCWIH